MIFPDIKNHSHSAVQMAEQCLFKYHQLKLLKSPKEEFSRETQKGIDDHKFLEHNLKYQKPLPPHLEKMYPILDHLSIFLAPPYNYTLNPETQFALTRGLKPCSWFERAPNAAWWRAVLDVLMLNATQTEASVIDWKTGKEKEDFDQLKINSIFLFLYYPTLQKVTVKYFWIKTLTYSPNNNIEGVYYRRDLQSLLHEQLSRLQPIQNAHETGVWTTTVSGLCKNYCPVSKANMCPAYPPKK